MENEQAREIVTEMVNEAINLGVKRSRSVFAGSVAGMSYIGAILDVIGMVELHRSRSTSEAQKEHISDFFDNIETSDLFRILVDNRDAGKTLLATTALMRKRRDSLGRAVKKQKGDPLQILASIARKT